MNILERMPWAAQNAVFNKLSDIVEVAHLSGKTRDEYEASLKRYRDSFDVFETAKEDGLAEGRAEGLAEGRAEGRIEGAKQKSIDIARKMKSKGMDIDIISDMTSLSKEEILAL